ncbi:TPA: carbohydrate ABC transporter permease [Streptococcus suis]
MNSAMQTDFDRRILILNRLLLGFIVVITILPLIYILVASFMEPTTLLNKGISFNPKDWTTQGYARVLSDPAIVRGFFNSIFYSVAFSVITVGISMLTAYPLSRKDLVGRKWINIFLLITMFFGGGLVPTYLLIRQLGMLDTIWSILIPGAVNVWNIILIRTYCQNLPEELIEAAVIDGANDFQIFLKIIVPLAKPIMFVLFLYAFVGQWNSYFDAMIYLKSPELEPLQLVLRRILVQNQVNQEMIGTNTAMQDIQKLAEMIKYATIVISSAPLLIMYPFFQKYFDKGILVGSLKG